MSQSMPSSISLTDPMEREGSGTAWLPDSTPMFGKMLMSPNGNMLMLHGAAMPRYTHVGSKRGDRRVDAPNWFMGMLSHPLTEDSQLGLRGMFSLDPVTEGGYGYPLLFQTGESWHHQPLHDRQHPHDLIDELSATYSRRIAAGRSAYLYLGYPGEPALGPPTYMHRLIAYDLADAPIGHHWQDATHITFGVATLGLELTQRLKVEGSVFTGREPDENRYSFDKPRFDSHSGRLSWNPDANNALQVSYGFVKNAEGDGADQHRTTASWIYNRPLGRDANFTTTLVWGQNDLNGSGKSNSYLAEADYQHGRDTLFTRIENIQKSGRELVLPPPLDTTENHTLDEYTLGYVRDLSHGTGIDTGLGAALTVDTKPSGLSGVYGGGTPVSFQIYLRFRPSRADRGSMSAMDEMPMAMPQTKENGSAKPNSNPSVPSIGDTSMPVQAPAPPAAVAPAAPSSAISTPAEPVKQITPSPTISPSLSPNPPAAGKPVALTALISDAAGKPITSAVVSAEIAMVSMDMGTVHIALKESAPGRYQAAARFTMAGPWRVLLRAKTKDGKALSKTLSVQVGM